MFVWKSFFENIKPKISTGNYLKIKFHSDEQDTGQGAAFNYLIFKETVKRNFMCDFEEMGLCDIKFTKGRVNK